MTFARYGWCRLVLQVYIYIDVGIVNNFRLRYLCNGLHAASSDTVCHFVCRESRYLYGRADVAAAAVAENYFLAVLWDVRVCLA